MRNLVRFAVVGLLQNGASFVLVLGLTNLGLAPWAAFVIVFPLAVASTYWLNSRWTFGERKKRKATPYAYALVYLSAYALTLTVSAALTALQMPDGWTVFVTIGAIGLYTFIVLNRRVFG